MSKYNRYKRLKEQVSTNGGVSWDDTGVYKKGDFVDSGDWDSKEDCEIGYYPPYSILYSTKASIDYSYKFKINDNAVDISAHPDKTDELAIFDVGEKLTSLRYFCNGMRTLTSIEFVGVWDSVELEDMYGMFYGCTDLKTIKGFEKLNTENVTSMCRMFYQCKTLTDFDLSSWITPNLKITNRMFYGCTNLEKLDLSNFNTENVDNLQLMFYNCTSLNYIKCTQSFKDWCETNKDTLYLNNYNTIQWDIV